MTRQPDKAREPTPGAVKAVGSSRLSPSRTKRRASLAPASGKTVNARLEAALARMRIRSTDTILEVGCGHGVAADMICQQLSDGYLVAIDRSPKMIAAARRRNAAHVSAGRAEFVVADFETFDPGRRRFDIILALRVGLFHRESRRAHAIASRWLKPRGRVVAEFDEPGKA